MQAGESALDIWVIYKKPRDFPGHFVLRRWRVTGGGGAPEATCALALTLDGARELVPRGLVCTARAPGDDTCIVETWL